jgi:TolB-like protein/tetratricopeptide (TPR) repeat protein
VDDMDGHPARSSFLAQLRKRQVFRAAISYGVVAFALVQLISAVGHPIGIDDVGFRWILLLLIVGFPICIAGAWYFEISDSGLRLDDRFRSWRPGRRAEIAFLSILFIASIGLAVFLWLRPPVDDVRSSVPSIAVLPFVSLGTPNDILSEGLPDQLLARLAQLTEFHVIARTSSFSDSLKGKDVRVIGRELGADQVLEGSVAQQGNRVLITAQLIQAESARHVWSETYDRRADNLIDVEIDIAQQIARALKVVLSPKSSDALTKVSTKNPQAFDLNLQGWNYYWRPRSEASLKTAVELFDRAIALDGAFEDPVVGKCQALLALYRVTLAIDYAKQSNQICLKVASGFRRTNDVLIALGDFNRAVGNPDVAIDYYSQALAQDTSRADVYDGLANAYLAKNNYDAAEDVYKSALRSNAPAAMVHRAYGFFLSMLGRYPEAATQFEAVVELAPDDGNALSNLGLTYYLMDRWDDAETTWNRSLAISRDVPVMYNLATLYYYQHRYDDARAMLEELLKAHPDNFLAIGKLGAIAREQGDKAKAAEYFKNAYALGEPGGHAEDPRVYGWLASYKANLGDFKTAHALIDQELAADEQSADPYYYRALAFTLEGKPDEARKAVGLAEAHGYSRRLLAADPVLGVYAPVQSD